MSNDLSATEDDVRAAYRLLLNRDPDAEGFRHLVERCSADNLTTEGLHDFIVSSDEYQLLRRRREVRVPPLPVDLGGAFVAVDPTEIAMNRAVTEYGTWEPHLTEFIARELRSGDVFVDIGAKTGALSMWAGKVVGPSGKVIAFEPHPDKANLFLHGILMNGFRHVTLYPYGLSHVREVRRGGGSSNQATEAENARLMQCFAGDEILGTEPRIDLMRMDIDGHEPLALEGLAHVLRRHSPAIICKFNPAGVRARAGIEPVEFADQVFALSDDVTIIEDDVHQTRIASAEELLDVWSRRRESVREAGRRADGVLHLDLLLRSRRVLRP